MVPRYTLLIAAVVIITVTAFILYNSTSTLNYSSIDNSRDLGLEPTVQYARNSYEFEKNTYPEPPRPLSGTWIPDGWTGLPISFDNSLYKHPNESPRYQSAYKGVMKVLYTSPKRDIIQNDDLWMDMVTKYSTELGWNGILDALDEYYKTAEDDLSLRFHNIGEIIASYAVKPKHAVEITSRNNLHKAPLHGAVWQIIMDFKEHNDDNKAMFDFAENELCYFKNYEGMGTTWISCEYIDFVFHIKKVLY